ncbi:hypothetical protein ACIRBX_21200 [Kitasatospora sp. NPDC096147]|uniref:hypothetical protein n=1 Tax=Kitasatospora sp. NPDC096147 TaxID=3364093 RepID=UPI00380F2EE4
MKMRLLQLLGRLHRRSRVLLGVALACLVEAWAGAPGALQTAAGLYLLFVAPTVFWRGVAAKAVSTREAVLVLAVGLTVITDLVIALGVNTVLPLFGDEHPLSRRALSGAMAMTLVLLGTFLPEEPRAAKAPRRPGLPYGLGPVAGLGALALVLSVAGPTRLNNGFSGKTSMAALVVIAALLVLLTVRRRRYSAPLVSLGLYAASASLLLLNSLRGWYIVGHDVQREYEYFRLTLGGGYWDVSAYPDAYNACLSITLLPVSLVRLTAISDVYVFKLVLPLLFAFTPVLVYRSVRNVAPQFVALLSAVYFMVFPTFFTDMTFLGRQEVAFLLIGCAMVVLTDGARPLRTRRVLFLVLLGGVVLSHYSTIYLMVAVLGLGVAVDLGWRLLALRKGRKPRRRPRRDHAASFVTWWMVLLAAGMALLWAGPVTHTNGQLGRTVAGVVKGLVDPGSVKSGSSDTGYSVFGGGRVSPEQRITDYRSASVEWTAADRAAGELLPMATVDAYKTGLAPVEELPPTAAGRALEAVGVSVSGLNSLLRQGAAQLLQVLLLVGVVVAFRARRRIFQPVRDQLTLTVGAVTVIALLTVVPQLSVDYGVLRAFQQGLFVFAPFVAAGTLWLARWAGRRAVPVVCVLVTGLFLDLTGVVPQLLGGYPAQLQLNNSGRAYDIYHPTTEERLAAYWLERTTAGQKPQQLVQTDAYTFARLQTLIEGPAVGDLFPTAVRAHAYVILGTATVRSGQVTFAYQGDLITYQYPVGLLDSTKNRIYSSEGAAIYR